MEKMKKVMYGLMILSLLAQQYLTLFLQAHEEIELGILAMRTQDDSTLKREWETEAKKSSCFSIVTDKDKGVIIRW